MTDRSDLAWAVTVERTSKETYWVKARTQPEACEKATDRSALFHAADTHRAIDWKVVPDG